MFIGAIIQVAASLVSVWIGISLTGVSVISAIWFYSWTVRSRRNKDARETLMVALATKADEKDLKQHIELNEMQFKSIEDKIMESNRSFENLNDNIVESNRQVLVQINKYADKIDKYQSHTDRRIEDNRKEFAIQLNDHQKQIIGILKSNH